MRRYYNNPAPLYCPISGCSENLQPLANGQVYGFRSYRGINVCSQECFVKLVRFFEIHDWVNESPEAKVEQARNYVALKMMELVPFIDVLYAEYRRRGLGNFRTGGGGLAAVLDHYGCLQGYGHLGVD